MSYIINEQELYQLIEDALKFRALKAWKVEEWGNYYDALSDNFDIPVEDYEDYHKIVANYIEEKIKDGKLCM